MNSRLLLLTKVQFQNAFNARSRKSRISQSALTLVILLAYSVLYTKMFLSTFAEGDRTYVAYYMGYLGTLMIFLFAITNSQGMLFGFRDYDTLMAMPFKKSEIIFSKIIVFVMMEFLYAAALILPGMLLYGITMHMNALFYLLIFTGFLFFPLIPVVLASLIGIGVRHISAGKRFGTLIQNAANIILFLVIYFSFLAINNGGAGDISHSMNAIGKVLFFTGWYIDGAVKGNIVSFLLYALISLAVFACFTVFLSRVILRINEKSMQGYHVENFRIQKTKRQSVFRTLFTKELRTFLRNFYYVFNTAFGMILMAGLSVYLCFMGDDLRSVMGQVSELSPFYAAAIWQGVILLIALFGQLTNTAASSISLEGKTLWILKTLPVSETQIFFAKIMVNMCVILIPSILSMILFGFAFAFPPLYYLCGFLFLSAGAMSVSVFGLLVNLRFPKLDWDRDVQAVKQSMSSFISLFVPMMVFIGLGIGFVSALEKEISLFPYYLAGYIVLDVLMTYLLLTWGKKKFARLA